MSTYQVNCVGCGKLFQLNCKNCNKVQFIDSDKDSDKKNLNCINCGITVNDAEHKCTRWLSNPKPAKTDVKNNPENFINLNKKSIKYKNLRKKPSIIGDEAPNTNFNESSKPLSSAEIYKQAIKEIDTDQVDSRIWAESVLLVKTSSEDLASIYIEKRTQMLKVNHTTTKTK